MQSAQDAKINRRANRPKRPAGGKALQRLFFYLGQRNTDLNNDVLSLTAVPKEARPSFGLSKRFKAATPARSKSRKRLRATSPAAKQFAQAIFSAASQLVASRAPTAAKAKAKAKVAAPPSAAPVWQSLGPLHIPNGQTYGADRVDVIGRVAAIAVDPNDAKHVLLGAAGGGIWESFDKGANWQPRGDQLPSLAIGAIVFDPTSPGTVYAGSGEGNFYANLGVGVYKSTDGGTTWSLTASSSPFVGTGFFGLVIDPKKPKVMYAATTSGFFKSVDSGKTWTLTRAGRCWAVTVHPKGGDVELLASFGDGLFASTNSGNTFSPVTLPGSPTRNWNRLSVDRVASSPDVAYAFGADSHNAYLWRRSGATWSRITSSALTALSVDQAWYDWYVAAPPDDPATVYVGAIDALRGKLSGNTWTWTNISTKGAGSGSPDPKKSKSIHPDQHCLAFSPEDSKTIYAGSDGGIYRSTDRGDNWYALNEGLAITEIEYLAGDPTTWKWLMAGTQDNGTIRYTGSTQWDHIADGDGGDCGVNQLNPLIIYHSYYNVSLERSTDKGNSWQTLNPPSMQSLFYPPVEVFGATVAIAGSGLAVTRTGGDPWSSVPLSLPAGDLASAMREIDVNTILIGTTAGKMLRLSWNGSSWAKTSLASPAPRYLSCIAVDPSSPLRIWVTSSQGGVFRSDDSGGTWTNCTAGLPNIPMNAVVVDPANFRRVWVAADVGVYQTTDLGSSWAPFSSGLPNAIAADLLFHKQDRMLICGTRNRGAWAVSVP